MRRLLAADGRGLTLAEETRPRAWHQARVLDGVAVTCLAPHPRRPGVVLAGTRADGVLRSDDRGENWTPVGLRGIAVRALVADPHDPDGYVAGTKPPGLARSRDGGRSWQWLEGFRAARRPWWFSPAEPPDPRPYVQRVALSPHDPRVLLAGIEFGALLRSEDGGATWSRHLRGADRDVHDLLFHPTVGTWAYQAGGGGPAVSTDGGRSWRHLHRGLHGRYCMACAADPERPEIWYVSASAPFSLRHGRPRAHVDGDAGARLYRAEPGGGWRALTGGLPVPMDHMPYALVPDPTAPGELFAGLADGAVWHTRDHGERWARLELTLPGVRRSLVLVP